MLPGSSRLKTTMGTLLSMHSVRAVLSITSMPRFKTSRYPSCASFTAFGSRFGSAVYTPSTFVAFDLDRAQCGGGVGREVRISSSGSQDDHAAFLEVPHSTAPDVGLRDLRHLDRGHRARRYPGPLERILQRKRVDDRGQHAHVVTGGAVEAALACSEAAKDVAATNHERGLNAHLVHPFDLAGDVGDDLKVNAVIT